MMRIRLLLALLVFTISGFAQDFSNKGKEFWIPYSYHVAMANSNGAGLGMTLYITSDMATNYSVEIFGGANIQTGSLTAGQVVQVTIPNTLFLNGGGKFTGKTVRVVADKPVVVYSYISASAVSGATVCLPTNVLGREYVSMNFTQVSNEGRSNSYLTVIAVEDNTVVEIVPSSPTTNGWAAGSTNQVTLNKGEIFQVLGTVNAAATGGAWLGSDLTGSTIRSIASGTSGCKRIAVFSGAGKIRIGNCTSGANSSDNLYQQLYPVASWGKNYLTVPSFSRPTNFYRIMKSTASANVYLNGTLIPAGSFVNNSYYEFNNSTPNSITSDQPIAVAQFFTTQGCSNNGASNPYDPDMILLNPLEQNISNVTLVSSNLIATAGRQHHIHVIIPNGGTAISSFKIDGVMVPASSWLPHPGNPAYSYAYLSNVNQGYHTLSSDSGFNALAYGYANAESYGYSAGANVKDLYQYISVETPNATVKIPTTCRNTPFYFSMTFPYKPTKLSWIFGTALNGMGIADVVTNSPAPNDSSVVNGKKLYLYKLPTKYNVPTVGLYPIKLIANNPTADGCGGEQEINFDFDVLANPIAGFISPDTCIGKPVQFLDTSKAFGRIFTRAYINFGDNTIDSVLNRTKLYADSGNYTIRYAVQTDVGCVSDTITRTIRIRPLPIALISGTDTACQNGTPPRILFTGRLGVAPYVFTYSINGGSSQTITTVNGDTVSIAVPVNNTGVFTYSLQSVREGSPDACTQVQTGSAIITVFTKPTATISGTTAVCHNATTSPVVTFTGASGVAPYTFTYTINGGSPQTLQSAAPSNTATIAVPTTTPGVFTYALVSVSDGNGLECLQTATGSAVVTVNPLPAATISGTSTVCLNSTAPNIRFTGSNATAPYTFTYTINGGAPQTVTTTGSDPFADVSVPTGTRGVYTYALVSVKDASTTACTQNQTGTAAITILPTPSAAISGTTPVCHNDPVLPKITFTGSGGDAPYTFTYTINGGSPLTVTTATGNSVTVNAPTGTTGTFVYSLVNVTDGNGSLCTQNATGTATVTVNPLPTATISGTTSLCRNATSPLITFTGANATAPYTFTYNVNGGSPQTVTTTSGNSVTVSVPTGTDGTFTYNLISVKESSSTTCQQNQTGSATITVFPLPVASYSTAGPICATGTIAFTDKSVANSSSLTNWQWNFNDPSSGTANTSTQTNPVHVFNGPGTYAIGLTVTNSNGCVSVNNVPALVVNPRPKAGFIIPEVCLNDTYAQFLDSSKVGATGTITEWSWNFGDPNWNTPPVSPNTAIVKDPQHSYKAVGNYDVRLEINTNHGCRDTIVQKLVVNGSYPVARFVVMNPTTLCANDSVAIIDSSTVFPGVITKIEIWWDNQGSPTVVQTDDQSRLGKIYKHLYPNFQSPLTKTYQIRFRAYSGGVCLNETSQTITVNAAPKVQFQPLPNICYDAPKYQITQASEVGAVPGTFRFFGPGVSTTGLFDPALAGAGTHTIKYVYTSNTGGCADSLTQTIKVWERAIANFGVTTTPVCEKQAVTFSDSSTSAEGAITERRWDFGDGSPLVIRTNNAPFTHIFPTYGTYAVKLTVVTSNGCISAVKTMNVKVEPLARPAFSFPAISCLPDAIIPFTNNSWVPGADTSTLSWAWNFGDPGSGPVNTSTMRHPAHTYANLGPFNVKLQVTTAAGCIHDTTIVLNTIHPQPIASFTKEMADVCLGGAIRFTNTSDTKDGTLKTLAWDLGDGNTQNQPTFQHVYRSTGLYKISLMITNSFDCKSTIALDSVSVNPIPVADAGPNRVVLEGGYITLNANASNGNGLTYLWTPAAGLNDPTLLRPVASPANDTRYLLRVTSDKGCVDTSSMFLKVLFKPVVPNTFTPNGDGVNDRWDILYIDSYPGAIVEVYNTTGHLMFRSVGYNVPWDGTLKGQALPAGTYYFVVNPKNGRAKMSGYVTILR